MLVSGDGADGTGRKEKPERSQIGVRPDKEEAVKKVGWDFGSSDLRTHISPMDFTTNGLWHGSECIMYYLTAQELPRLTLAACKTDEGVCGEAELNGLDGRV